MSEFSQIKTFIALVENHSLSKTAEKMDIAVSAVSRRLKELESNLGVQLIQRTTRKMHLTEAGEKFYQRCGHLMDELEEAKQEASNCATTLSGTLKIAAPLSFGVAHLSPAISAFMHLHPQIKIDLDMSDRRIDLVAEGLDLAIRIGTLEDSSLMARKLASVRHVVCASPDFLNRYGTPKTPQAHHLLHPSWTPLSLKCSSIETHSSLPIFVSCACSQSYHRFGGVRQDFSFER